MLRELSEKSIAMPARTYRNDRVVETTGRCGTGLVEGWRAPTAVIDPQPSRISNVFGAHAPTGEVVRDRREFSCRRLFSARSDFDEQFDRAVVLFQQHGKRWTSGGE